MMDVRPSAEGWGEGHLQETLLSSVGYPAARPFPVLGRTVEEPLQLSAALRKKAMSFFSLPQF